MVSELLFYWLSSDSIKSRVHNLATIMGDSSFPIECVLIDFHIFLNSNSILFSCNTLHHHSSPIATPPSGVYTPHLSAALPNPAAPPPRGVYTPTIPSSLPKPAPPHPAVYIHPTFPAAQPKQAPPQPRGVYTLTSVRSNYATATEKTIYLHALHAILIYLSSISGMKHLMAGHIRRS